MWNVNKKDDDWLIYDFFSQKKEIFNSCNMIDLSVDSSAHKC